MRKFLYLFISVLLINVTLTGAVFAQQDTDVKAYAEILWTNEDYSVTNIEDSPIYPQTGKIDPSGITPSQPYRNIIPGSAELPEWMKNGDWRIMTDDPWNKFGVNVKKLKKVKSSWLFDGNGTATVYSPEVTSEDNLVILPYWPKNAKPVSLGRYWKKKEKIPPTTRRANALYQAWILGKNPKYFTVIYRVIPVNKGTVAGLGTVSVYGQTVGSSTDKAMTSAGGAGIGTAQAYTYVIAEWAVVGWSNIPSTNTAVADETRPENPELIETSRHVLFDFNHAEIKPEQWEVVKEYAVKINELINSLSPNEYFEIAGGGCELGTDIINDTLGMERGKAVAVAVINILINDYKYDLDYLINKVRFASIGKHFNEKAKEMSQDPEKREQWREVNRRAFLTKSTLL